VKYITLHSRSLQLYHTQSDNGPFLFRIDILTRIDDARPYPLIHTCPPVLPVSLILGDIGRPFAASYLPLAHSEKENPVYKTTEDFIVHRYYHLSAGIRGIPNFSLGTIFHGQKLAFPKLKSYFCQIFYLTLLVGVLPP
jgi:hypothetical protein